MRKKRRGIQESEDRIQNKDKVRLRKEPQRSAKNRKEPQRIEIEDENEDEDD